MVDCHIEVCMNEDGDWVVSDSDNQNGLDKLIEDHGGAVVRTIRITVSMAPPVATNIQVTVPEDGTEAAISVALPEDSSQG